MRGAEGVVGGLGAPGEARDTVLHAQARHRFAPAGEDLVRVGLVADVPHDAVLGRLEHRVQRDGQLDRAEVGRQVPAGLGYRVEHVGAKLFGQLVQLLALELAQRGRIVDRAEQFEHP